MREILSVYWVNRGSQMSLRLLISLLLRHPLPSYTALATRSCAGWVWGWLLPNASRIPNSGSAQTVWEPSCSVHGGNGWKQPLLMCCSPFFISVMREVVLAHHISSLPQEKEFCMSLWGRKVSWPLYRTELDSGTSHATTGIFWLGFPWITYCL